MDHHVHTSRCNHATGTPDEYVREAIRKGLRAIGFNDHFPMRYLPASIPVDSYAMPPGDFPAYIAELRDVRDRFAGEIDVKIATEVDYYGPALDEIRRALSPFLDDLDYVYGSVHVVGDWAVDDDRFLSRWDEHGENEVYRSYWTNVEAMARAGMFDVVGHLDLPKKFNKFPSDDQAPLLERVLDEIKGSGMVVEINTAGLRKPVGEIYPSPAIIKVCFEKGIPVTLGSDAHAPDEVGHAFPDVIEFLKATGYKEIVSFARRRRVRVPLP